MKIHDITRPLHAALAPWPGDTTFDYRLTWRMDAGASVNVGAVTMGTHNGTHADAPYHFLPDGARIDALDPAIYVGPAMLVDVSRAGWTIGREALAAALPALQVGVPRLLLRTGAWPDGTRFPERIPTLAPEVPVWLSEQGGPAARARPSFGGQHREPGPAHPPRALGSGYPHPRIAGSVWRAGRPVRTYRIAATDRGRRCGFRCVPCCEVECRRLHSPRVVNLTEKWAFFASIGGSPFRISAGLFIL